MKIICDKCNKIAVWVYLSNSTPHYCDDCIPRGCSCNIIYPDDYDYENFPPLTPEEYKEQTDDLGRPMPCQEYHYSESGFEDD